MLMRGSSIIASSSLWHTQITLANGWMSCAFAPSRVLEPILLFMDSALSLRLEMAIDCLLQYNRRMEEVA